MSSKKIIINSILVCITLLILYSLSIKYFISDWVVNSESQWSNNLIIAEEIIYKSSTPNTIIVGSSLAARLRPEMFPGNVYNLSFAGKSVFDGLHILKRLKHSPNLVLIETNVLTRSRDDLFVNSLFQQPISALKGYIPALRERYHPLFDLKVAIFETGRLLKKKMNQLFESNIGESDASSQDKPPARVNKLTSSNNNPLFDRLLEMQILNHESIPSEQRTRDIINELKQLVDVLLSRGCKVVLFEMPMHPLLCDSPQIKYMRKAISETFSNDKYLFLRNINCSEYITTDGVHLPLKEAEKYAVNLQIQLFENNIKIGSN